MAEPLPLFGLAPGVRATPGVTPSPNSKPLGVKTGAPPRTQFYNRPISSVATQLVAGTAENRVAILTAPLVGFTVFIGMPGVTPLTGLALTPGLAYEAILPGLQELWAVTDAPVSLPVQVQVSSVLMAERERET